jgi:hypothetical protein
MNIFVIIIHISVSAQYKDKERKKERRGGGGEREIYPCNRLWRPVGLRDVEDPILCPHCLGNRLTNGVEVSSLTHRLCFTLRKILWYLFVLKAKLISGPQCGWKDQVN